MKLFRAMRISLAILATIVAGSAHAWPDKAVKLVVPAPAGGNIDVVARLLAEQITKETGQPAFVENKPGAGGGIGVQHVMSSPADGHTLLIIASTIVTEIPHVMRTAFDPLKDIKAVAPLAKFRFVLVGSPSLPANDMKSLVSHLKSSPVKQSFASVSPGTLSHYAGAMLNQRAGLDLQHIPFAGTPPALVQIMGGQVPFMLDGVVTSAPLLRAGKIKAFGISGSSRFGPLPDIPTFNEQGYPEFNDFLNWMGVMAAAGVREPMVGEIHSVVQRITSSPKFKERLAALGFDSTDPMSSTDFSKVLSADFERNAAIVKKFQIAQ